MGSAIGSLRRKGRQRAVGKAGVPKHLIIRVVLFGRGVAPALPRMERYPLVALIEAQAVRLRWEKTARASVIDRHVRKWRILGSLTLRRREWTRCVLAVGGCWWRAELVAIMQVSRVAASVHAEVHTAVVAVCARLLFRRGR